MRNSFSLSSVDHINCLFSGVGRFYSRITDTTYQTQLDLVLSQQRCYEGEGHIKRPGGIRTEVRPSFLPMRVRPWVQMGCSTLSSPTSVLLLAVSAHTFGDGNVALQVV